MPHTNSLCYEFGPYRLDSSERVLTRAGETISLTPKATDILLMLVLNAGQLVEKDELLKQVWPDTFVEEANLAQNIFMLRRALGDERGGPKYIETVIRRGYRFVATVRTIAAAEKELRDSERQIERFAGVGTVGSGRLVIAVLPFNNLARDPEGECLADSLTDNLINKLSRIPKLRVMSRSAVFRYKTREVDPREVGRTLGANAVLVGKINSRPSGIAIDLELVEVSTGWQLWGESFDSGSKDLLEIQDAIIQQLLATLKLSLTGDEQKSITARYTENTAAYESYLEGRYHWSRYTKKGIEKAIGHFRRAIESDPNYALAYAGIVDCYLRLATNYLPPEDGIPKLTITMSSTVEQQRSAAPDLRAKLRFEWDWKSAEREIRRANDLKTDYPSAHQWYAAYRVSKRIYEESRISALQNQVKLHPTHRASREAPPPPPIASFELTPSEQLQVYCAIVREQIDAGNYEAGCRILQPWWSIGTWPKLDRVNQQSYADLLFTAGELAGFVASTVQIARGQNHAEELLNGSVALFEQLGLKIRAAEARIELALCYHRQGLLDIGRSTLMRVLDELCEENWELLGLALMRLGSLERQAGRLNDALARQMQATGIAELCGPWITARCHLELASTYKDLGIAEDDASYFAEAKRFYLKALYEFEAVGQHRYVGIVENNIGLLLLSLGSYHDSEEHLLRSRRLFDGFFDSLRGAQVNETLARLYIETKQYNLAEAVIERSLKIFEYADGEALLAEALTTSGIVANRLGRFSDAKKRFEASHKIAGRCGDREGAGLALLTMFEEMGERLEQAERIQISGELQRLLATTQQTALQNRVQRSITNIAFSSSPPSSPPEK
jgi:DNA-binding winged helix-turn-helix (wHTH) protein